MPKRPEHNVDFRIDFLNKRHELKDNTAATLRHFRNLNYKIGDTTARDWVAKEEQYRQRQQNAPRGVKRLAGSGRPTLLPVTSELLIYNTVIDYRIAHHRVTRSMVKFWRSARGYKNWHK